MNHPPDDRSAELRALFFESAYELLQALNEAGLAWQEVFVGGGVAAVGAAVAAGLAVSPLARRVAPRGLVDVGARLGLPPLPESRVTLHSRVRDKRSMETLRLVTNGLASA